LRQPQQEAFGFQLDIRYLQCLLLAAATDDAVGQALGERRPTPTLHG
jgi:hypothetical protein